MCCGTIKRGREIGYKDKRHAFIWLACVDCGKERWVAIRHNKPIYSRCKGCVRLGNDSPLFGKLGKNSIGWKNGKHKDNDGYVRVLINPTHPYSVMRNHQGYVIENRLIMAQHLGRPLTEEEVVHHKNFVRNDNRIENLELFKNDAEHLAYHRELKKISEEEVCGLCKWFDSDMVYCDKHPEYGEMVEMDFCDDYEELP